MNKLRAIGYQFVSTGDRVDSFRRSSDHHYALVPKTKSVSVELARSVLRQCGLSPVDIEEFVQVALV